MPETLSHPRGSWIDPTSGATLDNPETLRRLAAKQVVCLGETHDRADIHRWQLHVSAGLLALRSDIALGFEMFPRRAQPALDAWVAGDLDEDAFLGRAEWTTVWGFDAALYMPLFQFCRAFALPMLALNCDRPLVTRIGKDGWDAVSEAEREGMTPARAATPAYRRYLFDITGGGSPNRKATSPEDPAFDRFVRAQQVWDRSFACAIADALDRPDPPLIVGIIGRGHLEYGHGTPFQLADLGVKDVAVALPSDAPEIDLDRSAGVADAVFRL